MDLSHIDQHSLGKHFELLVLDDYSEASIRQKCAKARQYNLRGVIAGPLWLPALVEELSGSGVMVGSGVSFPYGLDTPKVKALATEELIQLGAVTIDLKMNVAALKARKTNVVEDELRLFAQVAKEVETKVIIEVCHLTDEEIRMACNLVVNAGLGWVKSSTGQFEGPSMEQVAIILSSLKDTPVKAKVSGVKFPHPQNAFAFLAAGVEIIGSQKVFGILDALPLLRELGVVPGGNTQGS